MEAPRRVYRGGEQIGYYVGPREYEPEDDGICIRMSAVIVINIDHYAGNCRVCASILPTGIERVVCLNCLGEQSGLALTELSNSGRLLAYLLWIQQRQEQQEHDRYPTAEEWRELAEAQGGTSPPQLRRPSGLTNDEWIHVLNEVARGPSEDKEAT